MEKKQLLNNKLKPSMNCFKAKPYSFKQLNLSLINTSPKLDTFLSSLKVSKSSIQLSKNPSSKRSITQILLSFMSNTSFISKSSNNNPSEANKIGSLFKLFASDLFDIYLLLYYLNNKEELSIIDMLIHILHTRFQSSSALYLPQIVSLLLMKKHNNSILHYLLYNSFHSIAFGLKAKWLTSNYQSKLVDKRNQKAISRFLNRLSLMRIVYLRQSLLLSNDIEKAYRLRYYKAIERFYEELTSFYDIYRRTSDEMASGLLKALIERFNSKIRHLNQIALELKQKCPSSMIKNLYRGIVIPIKIKEAHVNNHFDDQQSFLILNVIEEHSVIFKHTKKSFAIKLLIECVQAKNCEQWDKLFIDQFYLNVHLIKQSFKEESQSANNNTKAYNPFNIQWPLIQKELISQSSYKVFNTYRLKTILLEYKEDFSNQEILIQFINIFNDIFRKADLPFKLQKVNIVVISPFFSIREYYPGFISIKAIKEKLKFQKVSFNKFLRIHFGNSFEEKQKVFVESIAACSLFCYAMNIREKIYDKMFINTDGHVALFKYASAFHTANYEGIVEGFIIPSDFIEVMDGKGSGMFYYYKSLITRGLLELRKHTEVFVTLIQSILKTVFINNFSSKSEKVVVKSFLERFFLRKSDSELYDKVEKMINISNS